VSARQVVCGIAPGDRLGALLDLAGACEHGEDLASALWEAAAWAAGAPYAGPDKDLQRIAQDLAARRAYEKQARAQARRDAERAFGLGLA
jgi:hypothetical protein